MKSKKAEEVTKIQEIPAGKFSSWLRCIRNALMKNKEIDVPCGECTACCTSSYLIHIKPVETETLARIPRELLFPAPGLPVGNVVLGYDENGRCPMFVDNKCSIYNHRPQTCRTFDCRIFPATGLPAGDDRPTVSQQAHCWKFDFPTTKDRKQFSALQSAAKLVIGHADYFPEGFVPNNTVQQAVLAVKVYEVFLNPTSELSPTSQNHKMIQSIMDAYEKFGTEKND